MLLRFLFLIFLSIFTLTILSGVRAQEQIIVGYDGYAGFQGPIWATKDLGLFEKYGLAGELVLIPGSARGMAALISGSAPFVQGSATAPLSAYLPDDTAVCLHGRTEQVSFQRGSQKRHP